MSFGNSSSGDYGAVGSAIDSYVNDRNSYGAVGDAINNYVNDTQGYGAIGNAINGYVNGDYGAESGGSNWGSIINTLGRLGTGLLGGAADYSSNQSQQNYLPYIKWLGHGLADFGALNNSANKQQASNNAYGNTLMLGSLFGKGFGRKNDTISTLPAWLKGVQNE